MSSLERATVVSKKLWLSKTHKRLEASPPKPAKQLSYSGNPLAEARGCQTV